jgi:hypothetical protein
MVRISRIKANSPSRRTTRPELPGPRRRAITVPDVTLTIEDLRKKPGMLVGVADLVGIGAVPSYLALRRQIQAGLFPKPKRPPSRFLVWEGYQITDWYDDLER